MTPPVFTFFSNKSGVGKTSLVYHLAWMFARMDRTVLAVDLDPQANLTAAFLDEDTLETIWNANGQGSSRTIYRSVEPLTEVGDLQPPTVRNIDLGLHLIPGDLLLSGFEDPLAREWPRCLGTEGLFRPFRVITSFWQAIQLGARKVEADLVLVDVGPSLGAINRSALIATDHVVVPLGADLYSRQGLRNLGPTLRRWRREWTKRRENWQHPTFPLPSGTMNPIGYVIQQHEVRLNRPLKAYDRWVKRMPTEYALSVLNSEPSPGTTHPTDPRHDPNCIATIKHFRSLVPLSREARKPIFSLAPADGAIGGHAKTVGEAERDFRELAGELLGRMG